MNEEFDLDDFENLLKNQTEKHRIYPSDAVWRNINNNLHGNRRWPALTFSAILIGAILTAGFIFLHPNKNLFDHPDFFVENNNVNKSQIIVANKQNNKANKKLVAALKPADEKSVIYSINQMASPADLETIVETEAPFEMPVNGNAVVSLNEPVNASSAAPMQTKISTEAPVKSAYAKADNHTLKTSAAKAINILQSSIPKQPVTLDRQTDDNTTKESLEQDIYQEAAEKTIDKTAFPASPKPAVKIAKEKVENPWEATFYVTPSVSYRNLSLDQSYDYHYNYNAALGGSPRSDVNQYVNQRPAVGVGAGASVSYAISNRFKLTGGLQFNFRQYNFKAYVTSTNKHHCC